MTQQDLPLEKRVMETISSSGGNVAAPKSHHLALYLSRIAPRLRLPHMSLAVLENFANPDVTAEKVTHYLRANPYYHGQYLRVIRAQSKREDIPSIEASFVLLGMQNSRNVVIALQAKRTAQAVHPAFNLEPDKVLPYALEFEKFALTGKHGFAETAFAAGLVFDLLRMIAESEAEKEDRAAAIQWVDQGFKHGMRTTELAQAISTVQPEITFKKFFHASALLHDIGKVVMGVLDPAYRTFMGELVKGEYPRRLRHFLETEEFGIDHATLGALCFDDFSYFKPIQPLISCHHDPALLKARNKNLFPIAEIVVLATNIAHHYKRVDSITDPIFQTWLSAEIRDLKIDRKALGQAIYNVKI